MSARQAARDDPDAGTALPIDLEALRIQRGKPAPGSYGSARRSSRLGRPLLALLLFGLGAAAAWFYRGGDLGPADARPTVEVARVRLVDRAQRQRAAGFSAAGWVKLPRYHPVVVTPLVEGRLEEVLVIEGDAVEKGQVIARIYAKDYEAELEAKDAAVEAAAAEVEKMTAGYRKQEVAEARAEVDRLEAELDQARVELDRSRRLQPSGAVPLEQVQRDETRVETLEAGLVKARLRVELLEEGFRAEDVALAKAQREKAEAERDLAKLRLEYTQIRSPMTGVVLERLGHSGQWVTPREGVIASLYDPQDLEARVDVNQDDLAKVFVGQTVEITSRAEPKRKYAGEVFLIEPLADLVKNTVAVRVKIAPTDVHLLHPDMVVAVRFLPPSGAEEAVEPASVEEARPIVSLPEAAVLREGDTTYVYVLEGDAVARRDVRLGELVEGSFEVREGLRGGERVVVKGQEGLASGAKVRAAP